MLTPPPQKNLCFECKSGIFTHNQKNGQNRHDFSQEIDSIVFPQIEQPNDRWFSQDFLSLTLGTEPCVSVFTSKRSTWRSANLATSLWLVAWVLWRCRKWYSLGWWLTYPSEKWWSSSIGMIIPNIWKITTVPSHQPGTFRLVKLLINISKFMIG